MSGRPTYYLTVIFHNSEMPIRINNHRQCQSVWQRRILYIPCISVVASRRMTSGKWFHRIFILSTITILALLGIIACAGALRYGRLMYNLIPLSRTPVSRRIWRISFWQGRHNRLAVTTNNANYLIRQHIHFFMFFSCIDDFRH